MRLALVALAMSLGACNPYLTQQSVAPPGRSARLDEVTGFWGLQRYRLELSEGVALALTCTKGGPCEKTAVISDDPAIAEVRPASLSALQQIGFSAQMPASAFVVVGKAPGKTTLHVRAREGTRDVVVTVIAPPAAANEQTVAR
jgi:hypothetical protein